MYSKKIFVITKCLNVDKLDIFIKSVQNILFLKVLIGVYIFCTYVVIFFLVWKIRCSLKRHTDRSCLNALQRMQIKKKLLITVKYRKLEYLRYIMRDNEEYELLLILKKKEKTCWKKKDILIKKSLLFVQHNIKWIFLSID